MTPKKLREMCSNLIIETTGKCHRCRPGVFMVNVEQRTFTLVVCIFY